MVQRMQAAACSGTQPLCVQLTKMVREQRLLLIKHRGRIATGQLVAKVRFIMASACRIQVAPS